MVEKKESFKVAFIGECGTGAKSSLIICIIGEPFNESLKTTTSPTYFQYLRSTSLGKIRINLWDTIGQRSFIPLNKIFYKDTDCFIIGFDLTNILSFKEIDCHYEVIKQIMGNYSLIYLVGNKSDLSEIREIKEEEAIKWAKEKNIKYFEVSAKKGYNVEELMNDVTNSLIQKYIDENKQDILNRIIVKNSKKKCLIF